MFARGEKVLGFEKKSTVDITNRWEASPLGNGHFAMEARCTQL